MFKYLSIATVFMNPLLEFRGDGLKAYHGTNQEGIHWLQGNNAKAGRKFVAHEPYWTPYFTYEVDADRIHRFVFLKEKDGDLKALDAYYRKLTEIMRDNYSPDEVVLVYFDGREISSWYLPRAVKNFGKLNQEVNPRPAQRVAINSTFRASTYISWMNVLLKRIMQNSDSVKAYHGTESEGVEWLLDTAVHDSHDTVFIDLPESKR